MRLTDLEDRTKQIRQTAYFQILALRNTPYGLSKLGWCLHPAQKLPVAPMSRGSHLALPVHSFSYSTVAMTSPKPQCQARHLHTLTHAWVPSCPCIGCTNRGFVIPQMWVQSQLWLWAGDFSCLCLSFFNIFLKWG